MKKIISLLFVFLLLVFIVSCTKTSSKVKYLEGEVEEITESGVIVRVTDSCTSNVSVGSRAFFGIKEDNRFSVADEVRLIFSGGIMETDPLRFEGPYQLEIIKKAPHVEEQSPPLYHSVVSEIGRVKLMPDVEISSKDAKRLYEILQADAWQDGATDCSRDCKVVLNGVLYYYHSDCGVFFKPNLEEYSTKSSLEPKNIGSSLELSEELKNEVNDILGQYITLGKILVEAPYIDESLPQPYKTKLNDYFVASVISAESFLSQVSSVNVLMMNSYRNSEDMTISYALYDIDGNKTDELLILTDDIIIDLYTIKNDELIRILPNEYGERIRLFVFTDGRIMVDGSHNVSMSSCEIYTIKNGSNVEIEQAFFYNNEGTNADLDEPYKKISMEEYLKFIDGYMEKSVTRVLTATEYLSKKAEEPDFYPDKFEICIKDFENVRFPKGENAETIKRILEGQSYTEPICKCLPEFYVDYNDREYGIKLSIDDAYIRLGDKQATLSPEDISELRRIFAEENLVVVSGSILAKGIENAQYIRTDGGSDLFNQKDYLVRITSKEELDTYFKSFSGIYDLGSRETLYSDTTIGFADAITEYDSAFFEKYDLYFAILEEGSGSIRHNVEGVEGGYVKIKRIVPEICTDDMANWHVILEVTKGAVLLGINGKDVPVYIDVNPLSYSFDK